MKKKLLALALALSIACSLIIPASAQTADDRLTQVVAKVKTTLALDTDSYTEFYGDLEENILAPSWYLQWYGQDSALSISATEEGKILSYYRSTGTSSSESDGFAPSFPAGSRDDARAAAQAFLRAALTQGETVTMEDSGTDRLNASVYRFRGEILLNGLPAGLSYSISVQCGDNTVSSFYRDDLNGRIINSIPSSTAKITDTQARTALRDTLSLRLEYVLPEDGAAQAVLRYLPEYGDEYYVDASTGKLVNLTELMRDIDKGSSGAASGGAASEGYVTADAAAEDLLSLAEQTGIEKLEGILDRDTLDTKARAISALGLGCYSLASVNYSTARGNDLAAESGTPSVTAVLSYGRQVNGNSWRRIVTLDAQTGELIQVNSSARIPDETVSRPVDASAALKTAEAFLSEQCPDQFAKTALYDSTDALKSDRQASHSFTFVQKANGYFFPDNAIYAGVDATDGSISSYRKNFNDNITFDSPAGIITADQALEAWLDTYTVSLAYIQVPAAIDFSLPNYQALLDDGISYLYQLVLGYGLDRKDYLLGIDARTGQPVKPDWASADGGISYGDVAGHWAQSKIETLSRYGVGYYGGFFLPNSALTQLDLIALLASTKGYLYDGTEQGAADSLYEFAYTSGLLRREERDDSAVLSRAAAVKVMLDAFGYGSIAQLEGIFRTKFTDDGSIPPAYYGYIALAQGLGMASGISGGQFQPNAIATRAQAAVMLYNLLDR